MMGTRDRSDPARAPPFSQNGFTRPGMGRFAPVQFLAAQRCQAFQPLFRLGQALHDRALED